MDTLWKTGASRCVSPVLVTGVTALIIFFNGGIGIGFYNHVGILLLVRRSLNASYLPGDFSLSVWLYHHRQFVELIAGLARIVGEDRAVIVLSVLSTLALSAALLCLCRALRLPLAAYCVVGLFVALSVGWTGHGFEENTFVGDREISPTNLAHACVLLAVASWLTERYRLTAFCAGLTVFFHLQIGVIFALVFALFYAAQLKRFRVYELLSFAALFLMPAFFPLWDLWQMTQRGLLGASYSLQFVNFRFLHHFELESAASAAWVGAHVLVQLAAYWWLRRTGKPESRQVGVLLMISLVLTAFSLAHFADYYLLRTTTIIRLQFLRVSPFISLFGTLALVTALNAWAEEGAGRAERRKVRSFLVYACLFLAIGTQLLHASTSGRPDYSLRVKRYVDEPSRWIEICRWIDVHGPAGAVYLAPPGNEGFAYLANRSTVVEYKIAPDGGQYLNEWFERLRDLAGGTLPDAPGWDNVALLNQAYSRLRSEQLVALGKKYGAGYAVLPQSSMATLDVVYRNSEYRLVRLTE
jgi:Domain of unknown function (DUF6798)